MIDTRTVTEMLADSMDEIDRLRAENAELREALKRVLDDITQGWVPGVEAATKARAILAKTPKPES